jgi:DNA polymerase-3 subunit alpha
MGTFVHLNGHSEHSTDGYARVAELVAAAKANGQAALALTDTNLGGALAFHDEAKRHGIKPIIGLDVRLVTDRFVNDRNSPFYDLTLLAQNRTGWHSLISLYNESRSAHTRNGAYVDYPMLARHADGLIALTGGHRGPIDSLLNEDKTKKAKAALATLESVFGRGRVFLEASDPFAARMLAETFLDHDVHLLATGRYRQATEADTDGRNALNLFRSGRPGMAPRKAATAVSDADMRALATDSILWQNAVSLTATVADAISADAIPEPARQVPAFPVPAGFTDSADYLRHLAFRGLAGRYDEIPLEAIERLNLELDRVISRDGATDYILTANDLIEWCRSQGILTAARGTSTGSFLLYCLDMTDIDPLRHRLSFDRFLRAGRNELPSLAFDIQHSRRHDVYDYLAERWPGQAARATSFIRAKADTARKRYGGSISEATAEAIDGRVLQPAVHACAVLIAATALDGFIPYRIDHRSGHEKDLPTASWDSHGLEDQGYLVLNLLFSSTLDVIAHTADAVRATPEGHVRLGLLLPDGDGDLYRDSTDAAWDLIASGDTDGVFQLGSIEANAAAAAARPRNLTDMAALIALEGRPARLDAYLAARAQWTTRYGRYEDITADQTEQIWLSGALDATHGVIIFQDQVVDLFAAVGGFTRPQAELAWRTLAKKDPAAAEYLRAQFLKGASEEHVDRAGDRYSPVFSQETAAKVFDMIINAPATFCAAHAYSYARVAFQTAWLRAHFPETFQRVLDQTMPRRRRRVQA